MAKKNKETRSSGPKSSIQGKETPASGRKLSNGHPPLEKGRAGERIAVEAVAEGENAVLSQRERWPEGPVRGNMKLSDLLSAIKRGEIDTVMLVFPDMQGRWMGKRVIGNFFADNVQKHGVHACDYLLAVDMEMDPVPGYKLTSWQQGYGDFHLKPDFSTLRRIPWAEKTAMVICDLDDEEGNPINVAPRQILKNQIARAKQLGYEFRVASELEFFLFKETYDSANAKNYHNLQPFGSYIEDYHILQGSKEEFVIREIRNKMEEAGVPVESSKGEWGKGQQEINLRFSDPLEMADRHTIYKHGAKEIAIQKGAAITFMAKYDAQSAGSSFHLHTSLWDVGAKTNLFNKTPKLFEHFLAGQMALARDFSYFYAPTINSYKRYSAASFAPTRVVWAKDNRTCGFRIVGEGNSLRIENRLPGADANPYLAFAATIASGLYGIEHKLPLPPEFKGDAYQADKLTHVPKSLYEAVDLLAESKPAKAAFGEEAYTHYLHTARAEQAAFDRAVTCWELARNFERI